MLTYAEARAPSSWTRLANHGPTLALLGILSIQSGQAAAKLVIPLAGPLPVVALRFGIGALILLAIWRPRLPTDRTTLLMVLAWGTTLAGISIFLYQSLELLPFGVAVTVQFTGALAVSVIGSRRARHVLWAGLAGLGIVLIADPFGAGSVSLAGLALAAAAAVCWGGFIALGSRVGMRSCDGSALALATVWAAVLSLPVALLDNAAAFTDGRVLLGGLAVAVLASVVTNSLDLRALRLLPARTFGVLVSLEPVVAVFVGLVVLGEQLAPVQWLAVLLIVAASIGASRDRDVGPHDCPYPPADVSPSTRG